MAFEQIVPGVDPVQAQTAYYALQKTFNVGWIVNQSIAVAVPVALYFSSWGSRAYGALSRRLRFWWAGAFAWFFLIVLAVLLLQNLVAHHLLAAKAALDGTAMPALPAFLAARLPSLVVTSVLMALAGIVLCRVLKAGGRLTWLWLSLVVTALVSVVLMLAPFVTDTRPLGDTAVEVRIVALAARAGVPADRIVKENCGPGSQCPPGRVIGLGPTRLMLLDSRLTDAIAEDHLLQVVAHEAKHYRLDNTTKPIVLVLLICLVVFALTQLALARIAPVREAADASMAAWARQVPLAGALALAFHLMIHPAIHSYRQHVEFEADRFGLELNRDNPALIRIMHDDAAGNPMLVRYTPITRYFRATHPSIGERIAFAETYQPWRHGQPLVYGRYFGD